LGKKPLKLEKRIISSVQQKSWYDAFFLWEDLLYILLKLSFW